MADPDDGLLDAEAGVESGEERETSKKPKRKASKFEDSSEEDDEDQDEFENDGFIVGDAEDDEEDEEDDYGDRNERDAESRHARGSGRRKRRRHALDDDDELDEEDLLMLQEQGLSVKNRRKLRRLKKAASPDDEDERDFRYLSDDVPPAEEDDGDQRAAVDEDVDDVDEFDDFIDDGGRSRRRRKQQGTGGLNSDAMRAARSVFGNIDEIRMGFKATQRRQSTPSGGGGVRDDDVAGRRLRKSRSGDVDDDDDDADFEAARTKGRREDESDDEDAQGSDVDGDEGRGRRRPRAFPRSAFAGERKKQDPSIDEEASTVAARISLSGGVRVGAEDLAIIEKDVPERLQEHFGSRLDVSKEEIVTEAAWIYKRAFSRDLSYVGYFAPEEVVGKIELVLTYIHHEKLDIPFIALYRKDYVAPELLWPCGGDPEVEASRSHGTDLPYGQKVAPQRPKGFNSVNYVDFDEAFGIEHLRGVDPGFDDSFGDWTALWTILDWDMKWARLLNRRKDVAKLLESSEVKGVPRSIIEKAMDRIGACEDEVQLADTERFIRLATEAALALQTRDDVEDLGRHNPDVSAKAQEKAESLRRRPTSRANKFGEYHRKGYGLLAVKYGIDAGEIAENLEGALDYGENYQLHIPKEAEADPQEMAAMVGKDLQDTADLTEAKPQPDTLIEANPGRLLEAARYLLCREILAEPRILAVARKILQMESVMVTATVTQSGRVAVHDSHPLRPYVHVKDKPVFAFHGTPDFAFMRHAASKGYCGISFRFQPEYEQRFRGILEKSVVVGMANEHGTIQKWNTERRIMAEEVSGMIVQSLLSEAQAELISETDDVMQTRLMHAASRRLMLGTIRPFPHEDGAPRVLAISVTHEEDEDPDPAQIAKDEEMAKSTKGSGPRRRPSGARITLVNLDRNGAYMNSEEIFGKWLQRPFRESEPPQEVVESITAYLSKCKPEVIVVGIGSGGKDAIRLRSDLIEITARMLARKEAAFLVGDEVNSRVEDTAEKKVLHAAVERHIVSIPDDAARLHCDTATSSIALPVDLMTRVEKRAIALGRLAQEPLSVYAGIAAEDDVASRLELHRLHYLVKPMRRVEALRRAIIRAVCTVGVDVNRLLVVPHMQPMLAFVGGLGFRKARAVVRKLEQAVGDEEANEEEEDRYLPSRKHLFADSYVGRCVFMSAAGFLRIRDPNLHSGGSTTTAARMRKEQLARKNRGRRREDDGSRDFYDPLDDSRIHPENYIVAVKIADEALRDESGDLKVDNVDTGSASAGARLVAIVLQQPEGLSQLDLEKYADHLEKLGRGRLFETIKMVAKEFQAPFRDLRAPLRTPTPRAEFYIATGADPLELRVGGEVTATHCQVAHSRNGISCRLPYNLRGYLTKLNFSDDPGLTGADMARLVSTGSDLPCRILSFQYEGFELKLTSRPSLLMNPTLIPGYQLAYDPSNEYILDYESGPNASADASGRQARRGAAEDKRPTARGVLQLHRAQEVVKHDFYHEVGSDAAIAQLRNAAPGEVIIRPSTSTGSSGDQFVFTAKFADMKDSNPGRGIIHLRCIVRNPGATDGSTRYEIGGEEYDSVDEALETFVSPVVTNMGEALENRKFLKLSPANMESKIRQCKQEAPKSIPYFFGLPDKRPLYLVLYYMPGKNTIQQEFIKVVPDGFQFRNVLHTTLDLLASWFKKNWSKVPATSAATPTGRVRASPYIGRRTPVHDAPSASNPNMAVATPLLDAAPPPMPVAAASSGGAGGINGHGERRVPPPPQGQRTPSPPRGLGLVRPERDPGVPIQYMARPQPDAPPPPPPPPPSSPPRRGDNRVVSGGPDAFGHDGPRASGAGSYNAPPPPPPPSGYMGTRWGPPGPPPPGWAGAPPGPLGLQEAGHYGGPMSRGGPAPGGRGYGAPDRGRGYGMGRGPPRDDVEARRGQMPVPAWKKAQEQSQRT